VRLIVLFLVSFVGMALVAIAGGEPPRTYEDAPEPMLRAGHDRDERVVGPRDRARLLRAAAHAHVRASLGSARTHLAAFDDLDDDDAGGDDGAPPPSPPAFGSDDDFGTDCILRDRHARALPSDAAVVAAIEESASLGSSSGFARRHEHPPKA
jgi:hypothetical protein